MPNLVFHVEADYQEVLRLRQEIDRLEKELNGFSAATPQAEITKTKNALAAASHQFSTLTTAAAQAGAAMENSFRDKIKSAATGINDLSSEIIKQKAVIHEIQGVLTDLNAAYDSASKKGKLLSNADSYLPKIKEAKDRLGEAQGELFNLNQQRAEWQLALKQLSSEYKEFRGAASETGKSVGTLKENLGTLTTEAEKQKNVIGGIAEKLGKTAAGFFALDKLKDLASQMVNVRGQFQAADTAIQTLLGSKSKADQLMSQVRDYAKISPLEFSDVTAATQMMLGFNIEAEKVPKFLAAIGDVSMGESQKFNSLTLAFSQMSAAGKLMGQDLNQMINAGFNPLQTMSEKTGKSIADLKKEMSDGKISAEMVQQAFIDATSEGGKFYGMSANGSKTIQGQMSMLQDSIDMAFNEMGEKSEGVIMDGIQLATWLVENYEKVGGVILSIAAAYGTYKASVWACDAVEKSRAATAAREASQVEKINARTAAINVEIAKRKELLKVMNDEISAEDSKVIKDATNPEKPKTEVEKANDNYDEQKEALDKLDQQIAQKAAAAQQAAEAAAEELSNAQAELSVKQEQRQLAEEENNKAREALDIAKQHKEQADERVDKAKEYLELLEQGEDENDGSGQGSDDEKKNAALELQAALEEQAAAAEEVHTTTEAANTTEKNLNTAATAENNATTRVATATENVNTTAKKAHTAATVTNTAGIKTNTVAEGTNTMAKIKNRVATTAHAASTWLATKAEAALTAATNMAKDAFQALKVAIASNPIGFIATALTTVIGLFMSFSDSEDEATEATERFGETAAKTLGNVDVLYSVVNSASKDSKVYSDAMDELTKICQDYGIVLDEEKNKLDQVNEARQTLIGLIQDEGVERQYANNLQKLNEQYDKEHEDLIVKIAKEIGNADDEVNKQIANSIASRMEAQQDELRTIHASFVAAYKEYNAIYEKATQDGVITDEEKNAARDAYNALQEYQRQYIEAETQIVSSVISTFNEHGQTTNSASDIMEALQQYSNSYDNINKFYTNVLFKDNFSDVLFLIDKYTDLKDAAHEVYKANKEVAQSQIDASQTTNAQAQAVDYTKKSFDELADAAFGASEKIDDVGKKKVAPSVDSSDFTTATEKADITIQMGKRLDDLKPKIKVDATEIGTAHSELSNFWIDFKKLDGWKARAAMTFDLTFNVFKKGSGTVSNWLDEVLSKLGFGGKKGGNGGNGGDKNAKDEIERRVQAALKTRAETSKMLQEVNNKLQTVERGSSKEKELLSIKARLEAADKKPTNNKGGSGKSAADKDKETREKQAELERKWAEEEAERQADYAYEAAQASIDAMEEGRAKKLAQLEFDYTKELDEIDREAEEIKKKRVEHAKALWDANWRNEGKDFYESDEYKNANQFTADDEAYISDKKAEATRKNEKEVADMYREEAEAMRSYLKDYGSFQQQRLAIAEEYAEKIKEAEKKGNIAQVFALRQELKKTLSDFDVNAFKKSINWEGIFNNLDSYTEKYLRELKKRLQDEIKSGNILPNDAKVLAEQIDKINEQISKRENKWGSFFGFIIPELEERKRLAEETAEAEERLAAATTEYNNAVHGFEVDKYNIEEFLKKNGKNTNGMEISSANAQDFLSMFGFGSEEYNQLFSLFSNLSSSENGLSGALSNLSSATTDVETSTQGLEGIMGDIANNFAIFYMICQKVNENLQSANELVQKTGLSGTKFGRMTSNLAAGSQEFMNALDSFKSGNFVGMVSGIVGAVQNWGKNLEETFGFDFNGSNAKDILKRIDNLQTSNEDLQKAIEANTEALGESYGGFKSLKAAEEAYEAQEKTNENYREIAEAQGAYSHAHHSFNYYWEGKGGLYRERKGGLSEEQLAWARQNLSVGDSFNGDIFSLSPEDVKKLLSDVSIRETIRNTGEGGYGERVLEALDEYAEQSGKLEEITDTLNEQFTQTTFDDLRSSFLDTLMDMDADAEDFADDFSKTLTQAIINAEMADLMDEDIETFYKKYAELAKDNDGLTASDIAELQKDYQELVDRGLEIRDQATEITGYTGDSDTSQSTSYGSASNITQDQADEISGRLTALQAQGEVRNTSLASILTNIQAVMVAQKEQTTIADGIRDLMANSYLELQGIRENTEVVIKPIKAMASRLESWNEKIKSL